MTPLRHAIVMCLSLSLVNAQQRAPQRLVWPKSSERPRVEFLYALSGKQDLGVRKSWWQTVVDFLFGEAQGLDRIVSPQGITVDREGRLYVTDGGAKGVHVFDPERKTYKLMTGDEDVRLLSPVSIAFSTEGLMYVSDSEQGTIFVFEADGKYRFSISEGLKRPTGLWIHDTLLYVVDTGRHDIVVFDLRGHERFRFGKRGTDEGTFNYPVSICGVATSMPELAENLYVVDALNSRVQIFRRDGKFNSKFGSPGDGVGNFGRPKGIGLDSEGHIYVVDALFDVVQIFDQGGHILMAFGGSGSTLGSFSLPSGIAIDPNDRLYVVDAGNRRIQVFQYLK